MQNDYDLQTFDFTDTVVLRFQRASQQATSRFIDHFKRDLKTEETPDILAQPE